MNKQNKKLYYMALALLAAFALWTAALCRLDVQPVGPENSKVGFAALNCFIHQCTGVHLALYRVTDRLMLVPLGIALGFAVLGVVQWIKRRSLKKVDFSILALGGFYIAVLAAYVFFEWCPVNYRPVLLEGALEVSYPSSTTLLAMTVLPTAALQWKKRIKQPALRQGVLWATGALTAFLVLGRLVSGVHWFSDIVGGLLLSGGLVLLYAWVARGRDD